MVDEAGCLIRKPDWIYQGRQSIIPMHGKKELPKGLVELGLTEKE